MMENGHGGVVMGSEISGGIKNVYVENCKMDSPELDRAIRFKTNSNRGGIIENIYVRNVEIGEVKEAILRIESSYDIKNEGTDTLFTVIRNINLDSLKCESSKYALLVEGIKDVDCVYDIKISNSEFNGVKNGNNISWIRDIYLHNVRINGELIDEKVK